MCESGTPLRNYFFFFDVCVCVCVLMRCEFFSQKKIFGELFVFDPGSFSPITPLPSLASFVFFPKEAHVSHKHTDNE